MKNLLVNKDWWNCALTRAVKTVAQTAVGTISSSALISAVDWKIVISASVLSGVVSILTSLAGLPEVNVEETTENEGIKQE